jgi:hypothetical protein
MTITFEEWKQRQAQRLAYVVAANQAADAAVDAMERLKNCDQLSVTVETSVADLVKFNTESGYTDACTELRSTSARLNALTQRFKQ